MAKKHKKKNYTTPKKIKHKHKNKPLSILKSIHNPKCLICQNRFSVHSNRLTCSYCNTSSFKLKL